MRALRHRLTILTAGTVFVTVVLISLVAYVALRSELRGKVDGALTSQYQQFRATGEPQRPARPDFPLPPARDGDPYGPVQVITSAGDIYSPPRAISRSRSTRADRAVAEGRRGSVLRDTDAGGVHLRVLTVPVPAAARSSSCAACATSTRRSRG